PREADRGKIDPDRLAGAYQPGRHCPIRITRDLELYEAEIRREHLELLRDGLRLFGVTIGDHELHAIVARGLVKADVQGGLRGDRLAAQASQRHLVGGLLPIDDLAVGIQRFKANSVMHLAVRRYRDALDVKLKVERVPRQGARFRPGGTE